MKQIAILALLAVGVTTVFAQGAGPRPGGPGGPNGPGMRRPGGRMMKMQEEIFKQLNLTAAQKTKIAALQKSSMAKLKATFEASKGDREAMRDKVMAMRKDNEKALAAILTPVQMKKYQALRKAQMEKMRQQYGGRPGGPAPKP